MSGHSHWAGIKHQKEAADAKRGKIFSKIAKDIMLAVRDGGADPEMNLKLRYAMDKAREANMPKINVERAIKKITGEGGAITLQELLYEGYGPGGSAILVHVITDNRNRVNSELRKIFDTRGGKMGESGSVSYLFDKKAVITVPVTAGDEDTIMTIVMDAEAENIEKQGEYYEIIAGPTNLQKVRSALEAAKIPVHEAEIVHLPKSPIELSAEHGEKLLTLISMLEEHDDVQNVFSNYDPPDDVLQKFEEKE